LTVVEFVMLCYELLTEALVTTLFIGHCCMTRAP